jgi:acyl-CoA synthetase (AMP-forming)/AMP-acid ligase II
MVLYDETLIRSFERACEEYADHTAIIYLGEQLLPKSKVRKLLRREIGEEERRRIEKGERVIQV